MSEESTAPAPGGERLSTGIRGLDDVLHGGLIPRRTYMIRGEPGTGKTLLGLHYLTAGGPAEDALFVTLAQSATDIQHDAEQFGLDMSDVAFLDLSPTAEFFAEEQSYDIFPSEEVESAPVSNRIRETMEDVQPDRLFVDPVTQFRYLASDEFQFRKQVLSFLEYAKRYDSTVLFTSQATPEYPDVDVQFMSDCLVHLGYERRKRTLEVTKYRGSGFQSGLHAVRIDDAGMSVFPELVPGEHRTEFTAASISSGVPELDELLKGGLERGTVTIISGPTGVGKTTLGAQFMKEAAGRGERSVIYMFEESKATFLHRLGAINVPAAKMVERGTLSVKEIEPLTTSPEEFAADVRDEVEEEGAQIVMVDGLDGYRNSITGGQEELSVQIHSLGRYLRNMGVTGLFVGEMRNITGEFRATKHEVSYVADNIVVLRYIEVEGELQKAIGVLKKRGSDFERSLREFAITEYGLSVGEPLTGLRGILSGSPEFVEPDGE